MTRGHPSAEAFEAWLENPVTMWVMRAMSIVAEKNKASWIDASWEAGIVDERLLIETKTRSDAYRALTEASYEDWLSHNETDEETAAREAGDKGEDE
jgi:hypothetical protein